jgi:hypothetical protein
VVQSFFVYSRPVVRVNDFVKLSAVRGINLLTGALVSGGAAAEATQAIANVRALLGAAGCRLKDVDGLPVSFLIMKGTQVTVACRPLLVDSFLVRG